MPTAYFAFDDTLRPLLGPNRTELPIRVDFRGPQSAKHLIEALGIPHTEIAQMAVNAHPERIGYLVQDGDHISIRGVEHVDTPASPRFLLDGHLGRLAFDLRMLGMDCRYDRQPEDLDLIRIAIEEQRCLLTRDRRLLMRKDVLMGCLVRSLDPEDQLREICLRFRVLRWAKPFSRCIRCNGQLGTVVKDAIMARLLPLTRRYYHAFDICTDCGQLYWRGSHVNAMLAKIRRLESRLQQP